MNDKTSDKRLLPCPFCGAKAAFAYIEKMYKEYPAISCTNDKCFAGKIFILFTTKEEAITAWNTRKPMERIVERLEEELALSDKEKLRCINEDALQFDIAKGYATGIYNAIEIVKEEIEISGGRG